MVHVNKCPLVIKHRTAQRGKPTTEFHIDGKPQIYCMGWMDMYNDEPLPECKKCADFVYGEQIEKDYETYKQKLKEKK